MHWRSLARKRIGGQNGWSLLGATTILAIVSVLVLVSFSRLRDFILAENEQDALAAVRMMTQLLDEELDVTTIHGLVEAHGLEHRLADASFPLGAHVMQRHGYFFEICRLDGDAFPPPGSLAPASRPAERSVQAAERPEGSSSAESAAPTTGPATAGAIGAGSGPRFVVRAWPCVPGESGSTVLVGIPGAGTLGHANPTHRWGGPEKPPALPVDASAWSATGWRAVR